MPRTVRHAALATCALLLGACTGLQEGSRAGDPGDSPFTPMPRGNEVADQLFLDADAAFYAGDYVSAQRDFGTLFIVNPAYRGGVAEQALTATCDRMGVDCDLVLGRLMLMREVYYNRWGPIDSWVPAQRQDYLAILYCYETALLGDPLAANAAGTPVLGSPDPVFAESARRCVETTTDAVAAAERQRQADAALLVWFDHQPCMDQNRQGLLAASAASDWEAFVAIEPAYQACAGPLSDIIDAGVLAGDPRIGMEHDIAWSDMSEIDAILEDNARDIEATRRGIADLQADPDYHRLRVEHDNLAFEEGRLETQITSLETARDTLTGNNRTSVEAQIATLQNALVAVRTQKREVIGSINRLRRSHGLSPRETP